jgi:hypothetical protein
MNDERDISPYLWDRTPSGKPEEDAGFARLEEALGKYRHSAPPPRMRRRDEAIPLHKYVALAACLALVVAIAWRELGPKLRPIETAWLRGAEKLHLDTEYQLGIGETVTVASIGRLRFGAGARFRILESGQNEVMELLEGRFDALIIADPYRFRVVTAGAHLDDLGCAYEVAVDKDGAGRVEVSLGWVRANGAGADSFIAQGYESTFRPGEAPSEPRRVGASGNGDVLSTLHQVWRGKTAGKRVEAFRALAKRYPPPDSVTESRAARADRSLVKEWWPRLPLGSPIAFPGEF